MSFMEPSTAADDVIVVDDDFLSQIEAAELTALVTKRRKTVAVEGNNNNNRSPITSPTDYQNQKRTEEEKEGAYTAALRGSRSSVWQQQMVLDSSKKRTLNPSFPAFGGGDSTGDGGGGNNACFKCGQLGHWSRDCTMPGVGGGGGGRFDAAALGVPEKACPCNQGACIVLVSKSEKNPGRKFYKCPLRDDNGGCGFFEWCDKSSTSTSANAHSYKSSSSFPDLPCPCGAGSCLILTAKTEKNLGQQFYRCPANQENSSQFFKWCSEHISAGGQTSKAYNKMNDTNNRTYGELRGSSCFNCGQEGHWSRDCPKSSSTPSISVGGSPASSGSMQWPEGSVIWY